MASSSDASVSSFYERVWQVLAEIPAGRVTTYGDIAEYVGTRAAARTVGWALNAAVGSGLPCHRVVNRHGALTGARFFETPDVMEERLRSEGVAFEEDGTVDLDAHLWFPRDELPPAHEFLAEDASEG
jgi:methylated-DNA-protein-cysteine methyltransferase related protein